MASSQNQRYLDRLVARQRGAGTHKTANIGFAIQPLRPAVAPPPKSPEQNAATPVPTRRSSRSESRNNSPATGIPASASVNGVDPSTLGEYANISEKLHSPTILEAPETAVLPARRTSPRGVSSLTVSRPTNATPPVPEVEAPTSYVLVSHVSPRPTVTKAQAVAAVTPVPRGKRMRQQSPDKFLTTPEVVRINGEDLQLGRSEVGMIDGAAGHVGGAIVETGDEEEEGEGEESVIVEEEEEEEEEENEEVEEGVAVEEDEEEEDEEVGEDKVNDEAMDRMIQGAVANDTFEKNSLDDTAMEAVESVEDEAQDLVFAIESPENRNKRRKVTLRKPESKKVPPEQPATAQSERRKSQKPTSKRKAPGKKSAPDSTPEVEESSGEPSGTEEPEPEADLSEVEASDEDQRADSRPRKIPPKPTITKTGPKPKPRRRLDNDAEQISTFPVLVHRLAKSGDYTLPPGSQRGGVNPVDVINQVAMELVDKYFLKVKGTAQRKAVESYKEELSLRFLELTDALENYIILTARARQAQKKKTQLMTELLRLKQDRERVAVKMDDVRTAHALATKNSDIQQRISKTFEDISGTLERGKARQSEDTEAGMEGLEALVRKVSMSVTGGGSDGVGLLATVAEFNRFLERAERVLVERRRQH